MEPTDLTIDLLTSIRDEIRGLRGEVHGAAGEISQMKSDIRGMRATLVDYSDLRTRIGRLEAKVG
jgi:hypothetical protein